MVRISIILTVISGTNGVTEAEYVIVNYIERVSCHQRDLMKYRWMLTVRTIHAMTVPKLAVIKTQMLDM